MYSKDPSLDGGVGLERGRIFLLLSKSVGLHIQVSGHGTSSRTLPDDGFGGKKGKPICYLLETVEIFY